MRRYRRRPKLMPAVQFDGTREGCHLLIAFTSRVTHAPDGSDVRLTSERGWLPVWQGDWLVRDPDTFKIDVLTSLEFFSTFDHVGQA